MDAASGSTGTNAIDASYEVGIVPITAYLQFECGPVKTIGTLLMLLGAAVGLAVAFAMFAHLGAAGPWLVNVALAKLGVVASLGLMAGGGAALRIANRQKQRTLPAPKND